MKKTKALFFTAIFIIGLTGLVYSSGKQELTLDQQARPREMLLGALLKGALESEHITHMKLDDSVSAKAMKEFLKKLDYGKQFLLQSDVTALERYRLVLDDELTSGRLDFMDMAFKKLRERQEFVQNYVTKRLKAPFDLTKSSLYETDPEKRKFVSTESDLEQFWEKSLQFEILNEYLDLQKEETAKAEKKNVKTKVKIKKLTQEQLIAKAKEEVEKNYKKIFKRMFEKDRDYELDKFYNAFTTVYDPHTYYFIPEDKDSFDIEMSGKLEGIGAILKEDGNYIKVEDIVPGSPSWKSGKIHKDDLITKVGQNSDEPVTVIDMSVQEVVKLIRGKKGTLVKLTIKKPDGSMVIVPLVRDVVEVEESYLKYVIVQKKDDKNKYGYIYLPKFYRDFNDRNGRNCSDDMRNALEALNKANVDGLVVDLRNNGGGALIDAQMMSGLFIKDGPIVQVKAQSGSPEVLADKDSSILFSKPMVVLVNNNSASASEILAAALQDYNRAVIVGGEHTHGKGTVQQVMNLDDQFPLNKNIGSLGALKVTIQKFYRVNGSSTQYKGVTPDIILPDPMSVLEKGERFLDYSLPWSEVTPLKYEPWTQATFDKKLLAKQSEERINKSDKFKKIFETIKWYQERLEKTERALAMDQFLKDAQLIEDKSKEFDLDIKSKKSDLEESAAQKSAPFVNDKNSPIKVEKLQKSQEGSQEKFKIFAQGIQKDAYLEESINILDDMVKQASVVHEK